MSEYTVGIVGTGPDPDSPSVDGFAMGYRHAEAYRNHDDCEIVTCADVVRANAEAFAAEFDLGTEAIFEDYTAMIAEIRPDIVSVTVPPSVHEEIVVGIAETGLVDAVHCEKPMADTFAGAKRMVAACEDNGVQLTFNRQRRFSRLYTEAKRLIDDGAIGTLTRVEISWGDFFDTGAHTVDLAGMFNDERPAEWVIGQLDYRNTDVRFGIHQENQMWAQWQYDNGVYGVLSTGEGAPMVDGEFLLRGTEGTIQINVGEQPAIVLTTGGDRRPMDVTEEPTAEEASGNHFGSVLHDRAIGAVVEALRSGTVSQLSGRTGLKTAEILFGGYESVRRRGRVDFPLDIDDNPLESMVESGDLSPSDRSE
jgi:predicted dehydrogenase